jgi:predicted kinase
MRILIMGLPGSGKSTFAKTLTARTGVYYEADMYFMENGIYKFDASRIKNAHEWCHDLVFMDVLKDVPLIVVSNTFTQEWEMDAYYSLAKQYGYQVHSVIVENRHGGVNTHGVPEDKLEVMKNRFEVKLI